MSVVRPPGDLSHLERLIDAWSREDPEGLQATAGRLRRLVSISALAMILAGSDEDGAVHLAFKGGASLELRFGPDARASRDVDTLVDAPFEAAFADMAERLAAGWAGFTGKLGDRTEITRAGISPPPQRCKIKLSYKGKPFHTIHFEIGQAEGSSFDRLDRVPNAVDLARVHLEAPEHISMLNVHHQIAQKIHACTEVPLEGENARVHDLYDIGLLAGLAERDGLVATRAACEETFAGRSRHAWPPALPEWASWERTWDALDVPDEARVPYAEARERTTSLIARIASA